MITPKTFIETIKSYNTGDKEFCRFATISNSEKGTRKHIGFWIEVVENDYRLVLSLQFESLACKEPAYTVVFYGSEHLETFIEYARQDVSIALNKWLCPSEE
jgi:hypothetical protein